MLRHIPAVRAITLIVIATGQLRSDVSEVRVRNRRERLVLAIVRLSIPEPAGRTVAAEIARINIPYAELAS